MWRLSTRRLTTWFLMIRAARQAVGVSQRRAGKIFGGGPTAFYKYETAKAVPSEGMARLLRLALERPELFTEPAPGTANWPTARDAQLLRRAIIDDRPGSKIGRAPRRERGLQYVETSVVAVS